MSFRGVLMIALLPLAVPACGRSACRSDILYENYGAPLRPETEKALQELLARHDIEFDVKRTEDGGMCLVVTSANAHDARTVVRDAMERGELKVSAAYYGLTEPFSEPCWQMTHLIDR